MEPFDFENALYAHSGLNGWIRESEASDGVTVIRYFHPGDAHADVQRAVFTISGDRVSLTIQDQPRIIELEMPYMQALYKKQ